MKLLSDLSWFEKIVGSLLIGIGLVFFIELYIVSFVAGDINTYGHWWLQLIRKHLSQEWSMPYFTPGRCGGFLLAADPQVYFYSIHTLISFIIPNISWTIKIANFILSFIFCLGIYFWMKYFGIQSKIARLFVGILGAVSGYWVFKLTNEGGFIHVSCVAYIPWAMAMLEELLVTPRQEIKKFFGLLLGFSGACFLMINSGYFWLQSFPFIFGFRILAEFVYRRGHTKELFKKGYWIGFAAVFAILLCLSRLGAIYEFQLLKFARFGGAINHMGVCGDTFYLLKSYWRSFFDYRIPHEGLSISFIGGFWECSNFIGLSAVIPILIGLSRIRHFKKSTALISLLLACLVQVLLTRTTHAGDFLREIFPVYNQITHYFRGSISVLFLLLIFIALGIEWLLSSRRNILILLGVGFMVLNFLEIGYAYYPRLSFQMTPVVTEIFKNENPPADVMTNQYATCELCHLFGYGSWGKIPEPLSVNFHFSVYESSNPDYFNLHDIKALSSPAANHSYYMQQKWPLWPKTDEKDFERFIHYKQVVSVPGYLRFFEWLNVLAWIIFLGSALLIYNMKNFIK